MNFKLAWKSAHETVRLVFLEQEGKQLPLAQDAVAKGARIPIPSKYVAYGASQNWGIDLLVPEAAGSALKGLTITAEYDDTITPKATEVLCEDAELPANEATLFTKRLAIPEKA